MNTEKMKWNVAAVPKGKFVTDVFPELKEYKEFSEKKDDKLLRVAFLATDQESPFVKLEREDYEKRLVKIFEFLEIKDPKLLTALSLGTNVIYEKMVNCFFMTVDNLAYVMWSNKLRMFHFIGQSLRKPLNTDDMLGDLNKRAALDGKLKDIYNDLVDYESQVFSDIPTRQKLRKQLAKLLQPAEQYSVAKQVI